MSLRRRIGLGAVALALLMAGLGFFPQDPLRRAVERRLQAALGPQSRIGRLDVVPVLLTAEMRDLHLEGPGYSLQVSRARAVLSPAALLRRAPILRSLELDSPRVALRPASRPAAETPESEPPESLKQLRIGVVAVRDASVDWRDPSRAVAAFVSGASARGTVGAGRLDLEAREIVWAGERRLSLGPATATVSTSASLDLSLESMQVRLGASRLSARGPVFSRLGFRPDLTVEGELDLADVTRLLGLPPLSGSAALRGRVQGEAADLRVSAHLAGDVAWGAWRAERVEIEASHRPATSHTEIQAVARALGGRIEAQARIDGTRTDGQVRGRSLQFVGPRDGAAPPARVSADVDLGWEGRIDGQLRVQAGGAAEANGPQGTAELRAEAHGTVHPREPSLDLTWTADVRGEPSKSKAPAAAGKALETTLGGRFALHGDQATATATARGIDLTALVPGARGTASVELDATGPLRRPVVALRASVDGLGWQGASLGALEARLDGDLRRTRLVADLPELKVRTEGELDLGSPRRLRGQLRFDDTPLGPLVPLLELEGETKVAGRFAATLDYDLPLDRPSRGRALAHVTRLEVERAERRLRAEPFRARLQNGRVVVEDLRIEGPGLTLAARGDAGFGPADPLEVRLDAAVDLPSLPIPDGWSVAGAVRGNVLVRGSRARPVVEGVVLAREVTLHAASAPEVRVGEAELALEADRVRVVRFDAGIGGGTAHLSGEVPFAAVWPALRQASRPGEEGRWGSHLNLSWDGVSLDPIGGPIGGELTIEGGLASLREPRAALSLPHTRLRIEGQALELLPASFRLEKGRVTASDLTMRTDRGDLVVTGSADVVERTVDLRGQGKMELQTLSPLVAEAALSGIAEVELGVSGPFDAPRARGSVRVRDGSLRLRALPQALSGIDGALQLEGTHAALTATGRFGGGTVELGGEAEVAGASVHDVQLVFSGREVALHYPPGLRSRLDADLVLLGRPGAFVLDGDVEVQRGVYEIDVAVEETLRAPVVAVAESELLRGVALDVRVRLPRPVLVRSILGQVEATGQLHARGDLQEPLPFGRLEVRPGGRVYLQGREFTVRDGALAYSGSWNSEVSLGAEAVIPAGEIGDCRVRVSVSGTLEQPSLSFSSPSHAWLSQQEVVSLVATGRLQGGPADTTAWLVGGQAGTLLAGRLTRGVAQTFGLDEITIRPDLVALETDPSARFTFGKHLGRRAVVVYSAGLGGPENRFVQLEGRPGRNITVRGQRTDAGTYTGGVGQRFEWGGAAPAEGGDEARVRLLDVRFEGDPLEKEVRGSVRLSP
ncbi:MAG TPA: translocation/assembly module TamB domain-containing protein, partial [Vicinamibacteria bacterium]|nr:translocation/assembly module TamB domain-containing protein [Vicinamibacteria bacterium]